MLVRVEGGGALAIGQLSHSWLSGQLARAWGNERFPAPEPREEIALGAEQHDLGWAQVDLYPRLGAESGLPRSFLETSVEEHLAIWREAPDRLISASLRAALVVSLHGAALSELRLHNAAAEHDVELLRAHVASERVRQTAWREALGLDDAGVERIQRQMWTWDGLSLALCNGWDPFTARDVPSVEGLEDIELRGGGEQDLFTLDPWPLSVPRLELRCEARRLAARYAGEAEMRRAFERARPVTLRLVLVAASG